MTNHLKNMLGCVHHLAIIHKLDRIFNLLEVHIYWLGDVNGFLVVLDVDICDIPLSDQVGPSSLY